MLKIVLSFDYELFLGENYLSEDEILFEPTNKIINILKRENVRGTFFADVCSALQYKEFAQNDYYDKFTEQLKKMISNNLDVQLHIHSNWFESKYKDGKWYISSDKYKIHDFGFNDRNELSARKIIENGIRYLESNLKDVDQNYKCLAYRAGGFCIAPEREIVNILKENGIVIDSSVALKQKASLAIQDYDFTKIPKKLSWWFSGEKGIMTPIDFGNGNLYEVPIGYAKNSIFKFFCLPLSKIHVKSRQNAGSGATSSKKINPLKRKMNMLIRRLFGTGILSLDTRGYRVLFRDCKALYRKYDCRKVDEYVCVICHPKLFSQESLENLSNFIKLVKRYNNMFKFVAIDEIKKEITND